MADAPSESPSPAAAALPERSDRILVTALGRDLQGATLRLMIYLVALGAVLATVAMLAR
jgi:hypothetical protein